MRVREEASFSGKLDCTEKQQSRARDREREGQIISLFCQEAGRILFVGEGHNRYLSPLGELEKGFFSLSC